MTEAHPVALTRLRLFAVGGAASLVPLNSTMIAVALPRIAEDFGTSLGRTSILVTLYLVVMLVGQPLAGRIADRVGVTRTVEVALVGFAATSLLATVVPGFGWLVLARAGQAVFGAALVPGAQAIIRATAAPADRGRLFGMLGSMLGVGAASGPIVGGLLIGALGWRAIFLVNLPVIGLALLARLPVVAQRATLDEAVPAGRPTPLVRNRSFVAAFGVQALATLGQYMLLLVAPVVLDARGWSPAAVGVALSGLTVGMIVMGPMGGRAGDRRGRRRPVMLGLALCTASLVGAVASGSAVATVALVVALTGFGFGLGFALPSVQTAALEAVEERRAGSAAGVLSMSRYVGSITSSLLVAAWITRDGSGARVTLAVAAVALLAAFVVSARLPTSAAIRRSDAQVSAT